jgi:hypothetical protein
VDGEVGGAMTMLVGVADRLGEVRTDDGGSDSISVEGAVTHCLTSTSFTGKWLSGRTGDDAASGVELDVEMAWPVGADSEDWRRRRRGLWLLADGAVAWRSGRRVRLVVLSSKRRMGEGENGGPARHMEEKGGLAAGGGGRCRADAHRGGVRMGENRGGGEAADCAGGLNQIKPIQNSSNEFEFKSNLFKLHFIQT